MTTHQNDPRFLFLIGTGRCGSTLLAEVLARHHDVGFISNIDTALPRANLMGKWNNTLYRRIPREISQRDKRDSNETIGHRFAQTVMHFGPSEAYGLVDRQLSPIVSEPFRDLTEDDVTPWLRKRFRDFFEERARSQGRPLFMHKFTGWPRARFIHDILPEARFIHVVRDGRAVANSLMQMPWWRGHLGPSRWGFGPLGESDAAAWERSGGSLLILAGLEWKLLMDAYEEARAAIAPDRWMQVRYEDLVEGPRQIIQNVLEYADLPWTSRFEESIQRHSFGANKRGYEKDLTASQQAELEKVLHAELVTLGYSSEA
ncbi:MAG: sulfotransferase [Actinomycetota bacterium]|nr:sulfotransferase [Actinomycetota bacterium]